MTARPGLVLAALCVASLGDVAWVRSAEQLLVPALFLVEDLLPSAQLERQGAAAPESLPAPTAAVVVDAVGASGIAVPAADAATQAASDEAAADQAWTAWCAAVVLRPPVAALDRELRVVSVTEHDARRQELILRVPDVALERDSPVTHRGVLVGFLRPWSRSDDRIVVEGRARVALLGHPRARPVAATWEDESLRFLVASRDNAPTVTLRSRRIRPLPGQLALSRNASALGDTLPAGLVLGRVALVETDLPGGALALHTRDEPALEALLEPAGLSVVTIEVPVAAQVSRLGLSGRLLRPVEGTQRWHLDLGLAQGLARGDLVIQGQRWVGLIEWVGPLSSIVSREAPATALLVGDAGRQLIPVGLASGAWPGEWHPAVGLPVFSGLPGLGGLAVGRLGPMDRNCLTVELGGFDPSLPVTVLSR